MKETIQFILTMVLMGYIIWLHQCKGGGHDNHTSNQYHPDTTIVVDTILPAPIIVQLPRQTVPAPTIIYIDSSKNIVQKESIDTAIHQSVQLYQDSLEDENLTVYYQSVVEGELLQNSLDYKLKIPKQITKRIEITKPVPAPASALLFNTGVGVNPLGITGVTVGMQFISNKGWALGYDYDVLQNQHEVTLGIRLWNQKKFR
ncbi:hypothetical protein [Aureispira sp. CCB-QB1]|uniref:hypothetical protein n=1 Tax=Aureispira sp. CCB-QB1 TaxID=1313421 RepID=UPI0006985D5F|nr:hypothetical protein [Aureispira sp. CCB-QB1]